MAATETQTRDALVAEYTVLDALASVLARLLNEVPGVGDAVEAVRPSFVSDYDDVSVGNSAGRTDHSLFCELWPIEGSGYEPSRPANARALILQAKILLALADSGDDLRRIARHRLEYADEVLVGLPVDRDEREEA